ncbi:MAG TPA: S8 family peptidase [bacterium]|nr:S8 family peptidase [bacterium]HPP30257.1 S8 family peptidase [bacterium]
MGKIIRRIAVSFISIFLFLFLSTIVFAQNAPRKIVVFQENFVNEIAQANLLKNFGVTIVKPLRSINGMAVYLPPQAERALLGRAEVLWIDEDLVVRATGKPSDKPGKPSKPSQPPQELPWGIERIGANLVWNRTTGAGVKVAVLDTGIDLDHKDLAGNIKGNINCINPRKSGDDDNGHGTHVAGIIAGLDNQIGVVGAGPGIYLYAVKVLDRSGSGWLSDIIEGLEWCVNNGIQVVNLSLGSSSGNQSFHDAISRTYQAGVVIIAAAGNNGLSGGAVDYPAKYPETIAVSAVGQYTNGILYFANFSSYGPEVDLCAPGVDIKSTYNNGFYETMSGTSMATPHVSGVAALVLSVKGPMTPDELKSWLKNTAENLGFNPYYQGAGLIRADMATW